MYYSRGTAHGSFGPLALAAAVVLLTWGLVGLLQKLSTNYLSAESAFVWLLIGYFVLEPWLYAPLMLHESITRLQGIGVVNTERL